MQSAKGEDLGRVVDVIVDRSGMVQAAIIDFGGFLGVGTRKIAVDWQVLHFPPAGGMDKLIADLPRDQLRKAPVFKEGEPVVIMGRANAAPPPTASPSRAAGFVSRGSDYAAGRRVRLRPSRDGPGAMQSRTAPSIAQAGRLGDVSLQRNSNKDRARPVSARSRRGLDWFVFFVADIQTGFGPFVAVFLTTQKWTQVDIGLVLTVSGLVSLIGQIPFGALVDAARSVRAVAALALVAIGASAFAFAAWPIFPVVLASRVIHAAASCMLGLALVSISLGLVGESGVSERLGRNAAFASAGTGIAAAVMGACGYYLSNRAVFFLAGALVLPAIFAVSRIRADEIGPASDAARGAPTNPRRLPSASARLPATGRSSSSRSASPCFISPTRPCCRWRRAC